MRTRLGGVVRFVGFLGLAVAAVVIYRAPQPDVTDTPGTRSASVYSPVSQASSVRSARSDAALNEITANSAPQQQVVNGWLAADLLEVLADQNEDLMTGAAIATQNQQVLVDGQNELQRIQVDSIAAQSDDFEKLTTLLLLGVLAIVWHGATLPLVRRRLDADAGADDDALASLPDPPAGYPPGATTPPPYTHA